MCTVSVVPTPGGHRLVCNRDELRSRPSSTDLIIRTQGGRNVAMPIDPLSGGTWIGAANTGLVACLLNANPAASPACGGLSARRRSRGHIVPFLLREEGIGEALHAIRRLDAAAYPPFRLLLLDGGMRAVCSSNGNVIRTGAPRVLNEPLLLTSSGLGDPLVRSPRAALFRRLLREFRNPAIAQERFHSHAWPGRGQLSVLMSRADARTVSRTVIDICPSSMALRHERFSDAGGQPQASQLVLARSPAGVAA